MDQTRQLVLFGFSFGKGGAHLARTMMLEELTTLLSFVNDPGATRGDFIRAVEKDNCLGKRSQKSRHLTAQYLADLYSIDPAITLFRTLLYFWHRDEAGQPLLALLCACSRDAVLRMSEPFIRNLPFGTTIIRETMEGFILQQVPDRFSPAMLKSMAQNLNGTWTQSGHLAGKVKKTRTKANATVGAVSYALLLGFLTGARGEGLFRTEYANLLDCTFERAVELAEDASRRGWIVFKRIGGVIEVLFPNLLTAEEKEWVREQN